MYMDKHDYLHIFIYFIKSGGKIVQIIQNTASDTDSGQESTPQFLGSNHIIKRALCVCLCVCLFAGGNSRSE